MRLIREQSAASKDSSSAPIACGQPFYHRVPSRARQVISIGVLSEPYSPTGLTCHISMAGMPKDDILARILKALGRRSIKIRVVKCRVG